MNSINMEYDQLVAEFSDAVSEVDLLRDFPNVLAVTGLREMRRAGSLRYIRGPRGEIFYPRAEAVRLVRQRMVGDMGGAA